jgi:uncharacterized protein (DUF1697 family)
MARYVAFLRGINVSGQKLIKMEALRGHFIMPGVTNISTYIQSGNVLFDAKTNDTAALTQKIEKQLLKQLGYAVTVVTRSAEEMRAIIETNPFSEDEVNGRKLYVTLLANAPGKEEQKKLASFNTETEETRVIGKEVYLLTAGYGDTKLSNTFIEKKLGTTATTRNWATMNKLLALMQ